MVQESSSNAMEMGTSDQILVAGKQKKNLAFIIGGIAMLVGIGVVITLVVVLSGNESTAEGLEQPSTEGPTTVTTQSTSTTSTTTTTTTTTTPAPVTSPSTDPPETTLPPTLPPPGEVFELEDIINGVFAPAAFNGTWTLGSSIMFRNIYGDLVEYDIDSDSTTLLIANTSQILQQSSRVQELSPDASQLVLAYNAAQVYRHSFVARYAAVELISGTETEIKPADVVGEAMLQNFRWGPLGTSSAFVYKNNIYYKSSLTAEAEQITSNGVENVIYNGIPDWVYEEEVFSSNNAMWFSKDGSKLAFVTFNDSDVRIMRIPHYGVPGSAENQYTTHHEIRYPKPGTTNPSVEVTLIELPSTPTRRTATFTAPTSLVEPILRNVRFVDNEAIGIMWTNRRQNQVLVQLCTLGETVGETSSCRDIFTYTEEAGWIDNIPLVFNEDGNSFVTILPQSVDGVLYKQIVQVSGSVTGTALWTAQDRTNTAHTVLEILRWTAEDVIWYKATSVSDSAEQHIYNVNANKVVNCFTCTIKRDNGEPCLYNEAVINPDNSRIVINCAGPEIPQVMIFDDKENLVRVWDNNEETSALIGDRRVPPILRISVPVAEGLPDADVHLQVPFDYEQRTNIPLLVYVYGGPESSLVTKQWSVDWGTSIVNRWGIAVAHIDGRGSGLRGVANTFAINKQLGSYEIEDQISVTRYLQNNMNWLDSNRTCIWGWSYGGYAASMALARGGDTFRCGIAVAPVVDWRFYDTIYTERYMDIPENNTQAYADSSLLTEEVVEAFRNKRYFLVHGTADDNVHYQHAMLLSRLLQRQDVYFNQMSYTDQDHGLAGVRPHLYHALEKFLQENMM